MGKTPQIVGSIHDVPIGYHVSLLERLLARTPEADESGCWPWTGPVGNSGYGVIGYAKQSRLSAHRLSYLLFKGDAGRLLVMHRCDNRRCINPDHLTLGTHSDNTADMIAKGRHVSGMAKRTTCPKGHPYDAINANGARICRACARAATARWNAKRKSA